MKTSCTCSACRHSIGLTIEDAFRQHPRWMDPIELARVAGLDWLPFTTFAHVLGDMLLLGRLVCIQATATSPPFLLASHLAVPAILAAGKDGRP